MGNKASSLEEDVVSTLGTILSLDIGHETSCDEFVSGAAGVYYCRGAACARWSRTNSCWGGQDGYFTKDCPICVCARHVGAVPEGGGMFRVRNTGNLNHFTGSHANGVISMDYGPYESVWVTKLGADGFEKLAKERKEACLKARLELQRILPLLSPADLIGLEAVRKCSDQPSSVLNNTTGPAIVVFCVGKRKCTNTSTVYGTNPFCVGRSVCVAARFLGLLRGKDRCGVFCVEPCGRVSSFRGGKAHGVTTLAYASSWEAYKVTAWEHVRTPHPKSVAAPQRVEDASWIDSTSSFVPLLTLYNLHRAAPHTLGNLLSQTSYSLRKESVSSLELSEDVLRVNSSTCSMTYRLSSLCSCTNFFDRSLMIHFVHGRELIGFPTVDERRLVTSLLQRKSFGPQVPSDLWSRIFSFLDDVSWSRALQVCHLWHREALKHSVSRKQRGTDNRIFAHVDSAGIEVTWHFAQASLDELNKHSPWIASCKAQCHVGDTCSSYSTYVYPEGYKLRPGGKVTLKSTDTFACVALVFTSSKGYEVAAVSSIKSKRTETYTVIQGQIVPTTALIPGRPCEFKWDFPPTQPSHLVFVSERGETRVACNVDFISRHICVQSLPLKESTRYDLYCVVGDVGPVKGAPNRTVETAKCGPEVFCRISHEGELSFSAPELATLPWIGLYEDVEMGPQADGKDIICHFWVPASGSGAVSLKEALLSESIPMGKRLEVRMYDQWRLILTTESFVWLGPTDSFRAR